VAVDSAGRKQAERVAAATALVSYRGRLTGDPAIQSAVAKLTEERMVAADNGSRETAEAVLAALKKQ
jgi:hypothetical protein